MLKSPHLQRTNVRLLLTLLTFNTFSTIYRMKVKCQFMLRFGSNGSSWKVMVRCEFHNHKIAKYFNGHDVLARLKDMKDKL